VAHCRVYLSAVSGFDDGDARQGLLCCADLSGAHCGWRRGFCRADAARLASDCLFGYSRLLFLACCRADHATILPPDRHNAYTARFGANKVKTEKFTSPLPQYLSDGFGWPKMVMKFAERYNALPPEVRAHTAIFCGNYGEASAVNVLGAKYDLPTAISGHQNYFYWGWNGYTGESVLTLGSDPKDYTDYYGEDIDLGAFDAPWIMDREHHHYFWLRHRKRRYEADWPELKYGY
jgi:hypothetical protein